MRYKKFIATAAHIVTSRTFPNWFKLLLDIALGFVVFAVICFLIFIIMVIIAHI